MQPLSHGIYTARLATTAADLDAALALRLLRFRSLRGLDRACGDADGFDAHCTHVLLTTRAGEVVCCFRVLPFASGAGLGGSYSAQFYDLSALQDRQAALMELGRFCLHPDHANPDILRLAWAALTRLVDATGATMLFGCSSFDGADPALHRGALGHLARYHLGPAALHPAVPYTDQLPLSPNDTALRPSDMPPLLRSYLAMGGWVSDHAVIDRDLNTLHVFTGLEIAAIPPARARALRALAALPHADS